MKKTAAAGISGIILGMALAVGMQPAIQTPAPIAESRAGHLEARSPHWPTVRAKHLQTHPVCEVCGGKDDLEVHHVEPFHVHPEKECDPDNLITLCSCPSCRSHLTLGHLGNYQRSNPHIREDAALLKKRRQDAMK